MAGSDSDRASDSTAGQGPGQGSGEAGIGSGSGEGSGEGSGGGSACSEGWASVSLTLRGDALLGAKRPGEAIAALQQAIALNPAEAHPRCLLALAHLRLTQPAEALTAARGASSCAPEAEWPLRLQAAALIRLGSPQEALASAQRAVALAPGMPEPFLMLAEAELANHRFPAAREATLAALSIDPTRPGGHVMLSTLALRAGAWRQAESHARDALNWDPENTAAMNNLGLALRATGHRREAVHYLGTASQLDPRNPLYRRNAISASSRLGVGVVLAVLLAVQVLTEGWTAGIVGAAVIGLALFSVPLIRTWQSQGWAAAPAAWRRHREAVPDDPKASPEVMEALRRERRRAIFSSQALHDPSLIGGIFVAVILLAFLGAVAGPGTLRDWATVILAAAIAGWTVTRLLFHWRRRRAQRTTQAH